MSAPNLRTVPPYAADSDDGWPDPTPLGDNAGLPTFPVAGLPPALRGIVEDITATAQVPVDLPGVFSLAVVCAALSGRVTVRVTDDWSEAVTLYVLGLAEPGNRKTAVTGTLLAPLVAVQAEVQGVAAAERQALVRRKAVAKDRADGLRAQAKRGAVSWQAVEAAMADHDAVVVPEPPTLFVTEGTPEALAKTMQDNGERLAAFSDEGGGLITMTGIRYASAPYLDMLLKAHVGAGTSQVRIGRDPVSLTRPILTVGVLAQDDTLRELAGVKGAAARGLLDRFIVAAPADTLGRRQIDVPPIRAASREGYAGLVVGLVRVTRPRAAPIALELAPDAARSLHAFRAELEPRLGPRGDLRSVAGFAGKLTGTVVRLAAVHHVASAGPEDAWQFPIGASAVAWGIDVAGWALEHYRYALAEAWAEASVSDADRVLGWLERHGASEVTTRATQRGANLADVETTTRALELLAEHGWVRRGPEPTSGSKGGRPPSQSWAVHPCLLSVLSGICGGRGFSQEQ
jgi:replicative DNA helicase